MGPAAVRIRPPFRANTGPVASTAALGEVGDEGAALLPLFLEAGFFCAAFLPVVFDPPGAASSAPDAREATAKAARIKASRRRDMRYSKTAWAKILCNSRVWSRSQGLCNSLPPSTGFRPYPAQRQN